MKEKSRKIWQFIIFILVITGLSLIYNYPDTLFKRPQSIHNWRQCDGASLALNYYQEGMHFFKPQTHMLYSDNLTTGYTSPSEIPVLYYFAAILYKIFGYHEYLFRGLNLLIFFIGLFYVFKLADSLLHNFFYSIIVTVLVFSSPLLVYYANNFMPNTVALSFSFIGWYYFYRYFINARTRTFLVSILFFGLAGTMKITELTGPLIILMLLIADRFGMFNWKLHSNRNPGLKIASIVFVFTLIISWVLYAKYFNNLHGSVQFSTFTFPIWEISRENISVVLHKMNVLWFKDYFYPATFWFMIATLLIMIGMRKRSDRLLYTVTLVLVVALITFSLLWFQALGDHDYFYIGFYVLPVFLFINFFVVVNSFQLKRYQQLIIQIIFILFAIINVNYAQARHSLRYHGSWMNDYDQVVDLYTIKPWLQDVGISRTDTIIFYPSIYIRPLYLMNMKGWIMRNPIMVNQDTEKADSILMESFLERRAKFFVIQDIKSASAYKPFEPYMNDLYAKYNSIYIFRIPPKQKNFNTADSALLQ